MSKQVLVQEYIISSVPVRLADKNEWKPAIEISSQRDGIVTSKPYTDETVHATEEAADTHGVRSKTNSSVHRRDGVATVKADAPPSRS